MNVHEDYRRFLDRKKVRSTEHGIEPKGTHRALFDFQKRAVEFALRKGRAALFLDTGLGKTICQLEWARQIPGDVLILAPLAVAKQAAEMLASAIRERHQDILDAWEDVTKEAHEADKEAVLSLSYGIKLDLVHNRITTTLGFSVRRKHEQAAEIEDPNQPALGFHEDSDANGETKQ